MFSPLAIIPVLDRRELLDYVEKCVQMDRWYEPPVSFAGLARPLPTAQPYITVHQLPLSATFSAVPISRIACSASSLQLTFRSGLSGVWY